MVTEGPESLVEFNRDSKEVRLSFLQFGGVLKRHPHRAQGTPIGLSAGSATAGKSRVPEQGLHGLLA